MRSLRYVLIGLAVVGLALFSAGVAPATPIYVDCSDGKTPTGNWNQLVDLTDSIANMVDSAGSSTGISVTATNSGYEFTTAGQGGNWGGTPIWAVDAATDDGFGTDGNIVGNHVTLTFGGLSDSLVYPLFPK